jgi:hypothetical protein
MAEPTVYVTRYEVSCLPRNDVNAHLFTVVVEERNEDQWAVLLRGVWCLGIDGSWTQEPIPSEREDDWLATHRFDLDTALKLAREEAPKIKVNGHTVADALERASS